MSAETKIRLPLFCHVLAVLVVAGPVLPSVAPTRRVEAAEPQGQVSGPRDLLDLLGVDQSHFDLLTDAAPWQEGENETLLKIMYRLDRNFPLADVESWSLGAPEPARLAENPGKYRGEIFRLAGHVAAVEVLRPVPEAARRFELGEYYRCRFLLGDARQPAIVFARTVPDAWKRGEPLNARAGAFGLFLKLGSESPDEPLPIFVTSRVAWYPATLLGDLGMDVGLLDDLRPGRLTSRNRECFYQMLAAVGRAEPGQLLAEAANRLERTGKKRFSVVPLFNDPLAQQGRLVLLSGTARQVIRIRVGDEDIVSRFGIDHYYQVFLFTEDSQGNPLVFCVRDLPDGMPRGENPQFAESVTAAGFFFSKWAYRSRELGDGPTSQAGRQAPLLIGRSLLWHPRSQPASSPFLGAIAAGLFVLALLGVWFALWRYSRSDRQFYEKTIAGRLAPDSAVSLDRIAAGADRTPDFSGLEEGAGPESSAPGRPSQTGEDEAPQRDSGA